MTKTITICLILTGAIILAFIAAAICCLIQEYPIIYKSKYSTKRMYTNGWKYLTFYRKNGWKIDWEKINK